MVDVEPRELALENLGEPREVRAVRCRGCTLPSTNGERVDAQRCRQLALCPPLCLPGEPKVCGQNSPRVFSRLTSHDGMTILPTS